ncbi:MAG: hypothetical protein J7604_25585 [Sporocytophaga sp.]|uniref:hypothetical protein n=1 Tax=Sporocytophaga sp. TaxID=2231183 RepID=UPI001B0365E1|nr:hypothetical protein [Sporocytophaga sp.]MBO9703602.1 hypothetical protein [Sporocytophaga sp.]
MGWKIVVCHGRGHDVGRMTNIKNNPISFNAEQLERFRPVKAIGVNLIKFRIT